MFKGRYPMRKISLIFAALLLSSAAMADIVYLKDGQALRGNVVSQDENTVVIETYNGNTETLDRKYVDRVSEDDTYSNYRKRMRRGYESGEGWTSDEWIFKFGVDFDGKHETSNSNLFIVGQGNTSLDGTQDVNSGVGFGLEYVTYDTQHLGFGGGITIQGSRGLADVTGNFSFTPIYALAKWRTASDRRNHYKYLIGQLGYNFFSGDRDYRGDNGSLDGGLYFGAGAGVTLNRVQFELLYTEDRGKVRASGFDFVESGDIRYSKLGLTVGFLF